METSQSKSLSPSAQDVLDACDQVFGTTAQGLAAALRAVADQVVPPALEEEFYDRNQALPLKKMVEIRQNLNAIAAELEGSVTYNPPEDNEMEETQWTMLMN